MKHIAVDLDEVLWCLMSEFTRIYNCVFNKKRTIEDWDDWDCCEKWGITNSQKSGLFGAINLMNVPVIDRHAPKYLKKLQEYGIVDLLTARREESRGGLIEKLESIGIFEGEHYRKLVIVKFYPFNVKANYHYDVYIDDNPRLANSIVKENDKGDKEMKILLWDQPWNWKVESNQYVTRVTGWKHVLEWFKKYPNL